MSVRDRNKGFTGYDSTVKPPDFLERGKEVNWERMIEESRVKFSVESFEKDLEVVEDEGLNFNNENKR